MTKDYAYTDLKEAFYDNFEIRWLCDNSNYVTDFYGVYWEDELFGLAINFNGTIEYYLVYTDMMDFIAKQFENPDQNPNLTIEQRIEDWFFDQVYYNRVDMPEHINLAL